jgi:hypothetical protein
MGILFPGTGKPFAGLVIDPFDPQGVEGTVQVHIPDKITI